MHHLYDIQPLDGNDFHSDSDGTSPVCNHRTNAKMAHIHDVTRSKVIENVVSKTQRARDIKKEGERVMELEMNNGMVGTIHRYLCYTYTFMS